MLFRPSCKGRGTYLLLSFENEFYIVLQPSRSHKIFESLYMHEGLPFVVIGTARIDGTVPDDRLERIGIPQFDRVDRLDIVMPVNQDRLCRRVYDFLTEYDRMPRSRIYRSPVRSGSKKEFRQTHGATLHIWLVLREGTYRRNTEQ